MSSSKLIKYNPNKIIVVINGIEIHGISMKEFGGEL